MRGIQRLAAVVTASLLLPASGRGAPEALGVVMEANQARLGAYAVTQGSTVFDGDKLSTGSGGTLRLRSGRAMFYLRGESSLMVRSKSDADSKRVEAELVAGEMVLSSAVDSGAEIAACHAQIRPGANTAAILEVRILSSRELVVVARRGAAEFSYHGEDAVIEEGKAYRVELDPIDDGSAADEKNKKAAHKKNKKKFILIAIGVGGGATALGIWGAVDAVSGRAFVSPDHP
jgi:hypothetical protein